MYHFIRTFLYKKIFLGTPSEIQVSLLVKVHRDLSKDDRLYAFNKIILRLDLESEVYDQVLYILSGQHKIKSARSV